MAFKSLSRRYSRSAGFSISTDAHNVPISDFRKDIANTEVISFQLVYPLEISSLWYCPRRCALLLLLQDGRVQTHGNAKKSFLVIGVTNWKDATVKFQKHENSDFHKHCVESLSSQDVGELFNKEVLRERHTNHECLLRILSSVQFLARQGLPLRGDGDEEDSKLYQVLMLRSDNFPDIKKFWG